MNMIAAVDRNYALGYQNSLCWHITEDLQRFRSLTLSKTVVMGRKTWESIYKLLGTALPRRHNVVLTQNPDYYAPGATVVHDAHAILAMPPEQVFIIGGAQIYALFLPYVSTLYLTKIDKALKLADAYFPKFDLQRFQQTEYWQHYSTQEHCYFSFQVYEQLSPFY